MKFKISFLSVLFLFAVEAGAQSYFYNNNYFDNDVIYEAGISFGPMNSLTDIGGTPGLGQKGPKDLNIKSTTLFGSIYGMAFYKHFLGFRAEATIGSVKSNDSLLSGIGTTNKAIGRYNRNLSFRSPVYELSLTTELHPVELLSIFDPEKSPPRLSPYLIGGIGVFHFNPQANLNGQWVDLRPLHTEGEGFSEYPDRKEYKLNQINIPLGIGVLYEVSPKFNVRLEYISRKLFTDYLDDVHSTYIDPTLFSKYLTGNQLTEALILNNRRKPGVPDPLTTARPGGRRGNPYNNDSYFTVNLKVGFVFGRESTVGGGGASGQSSRRLLKMQKRQRQCPGLF
jgi:hypothetical protein